MSRTPPPEERDRIRDVLDAIESGEIVIKNDAEEVIQEMQNRLNESGGPAERSATG